MYGIIIRQFNPLNHPQESHNRKAGNLYYRIESHFLGVGLVEEACK